MASDDSENAIVKSTSDILESTYINLVRGLTGLATSDKKELIYSVSRIFQNIRATNLLTLLKKEWDYWEEKGKIKDDYTTTEQHLNCLHELLDFLDNDIPDELRFGTMKKILLVASTESISKRDDIMPQQFIRICRQLSSGEIILLFAAFDLAKANNFQYKGVSDYNGWLKVMAENSILKYPALVELHEAKLTELKLLTNRHYSDKSGIQLSNQLRLSNFGLDFCKYVETYNEIKP